MQSVAAQIGASETEESMYIFADSQITVDRLAPCAPIRGRVDTCSKTLSPRCRCLLKTGWVSHICSVVWDY